MRTRLIFGALLMVSFVSDIRAAAVFNPATGHWYEAITVEGGIGWVAAYTDAQEKGGYLATVTSQDENGFITNAFPEVHGQDGFGYWIGGFQPTDPFGPGDPEADWEWVTGEPFVFTNWGDGQPDDNGFFLDEDAIHFWNNDGSWNDFSQSETVGGFVVEYNSDPSGTVVIDGCDTGVPDLLVADGFTLADLIDLCAIGAQNHGQFVSCVAQLTNDLKAAGLITPKQKGAIQSCAAQAAIP